jgi:hypothetical protein
MMYTATVPYSPNTRRYSQSELEEAVAAAVAKAELVAIAKEKEMQSREEALQVHYTV